MLLRKLSSAPVALIAFLLSRSLFAQDTPADLLLLHGRILTVDAKDSVAHAVAIRHGVIVKVGSDAEVLEFAGKAPGIRVIDLHGSTATPGLIDTHAHIAEGGVQELYGVKLSDATSVAEIVARVKGKAVTPFLHTTFPIVRSADSRQAIVTFKENVSRRLQNPALVSVSRFALLKFPGSKTANCRSED